ncbi:hypothetical protein LUZ60_005703 [Juncus effusus]|nr:hypothetical protein LUZ60_005703 [Juncus effusus]
MASENPPTMNRKRNYEEGEDSEGCKKAKFGGIWENLDLILSLQSKDTTLERKIELSFNFINSECDNCNKSTHEPVSLSRLISFLSNWIQPVLISSEKNNKSSEELFDPCFDPKSWEILKFCVDKKPSVSISPNLLKPITRIVKHALIQSEIGPLFERFSECISLIITSNSRAFYNAGVDLWINSAIEATNLAHKFILKENETVLGFSVLFLEHFSTFLRFYPNPKNIFRVFVDRLLNLLLELLVLLHSKENQENKKSEKVQIFLRVFEGILSNGLFHPVHMSGFFTLKNTELNNDSREIKASYHKHLFQRFKGIKSENKAVIMAGFGYLFRLFLDRTKLKNQNKQKIGEESEENSKESKKPLFEVFTQFIQPLLIECKFFKNFNFSDLGEIKLVEIHCMLKSINETLSCFIQERIYSPTEDSNEGSNCNFLKEIYDTIISISEQIFQFWGTNLNSNFSEGESVKKILPLIGREVFVAVRNFLEIEYKTLGGEIANVWLMIFAFLDVNLILEESKPKSLLNEAILNAGCKLINVFSELRQVNNSIFALFKAVRLHGDSFNLTEIKSPFSIGNLHLAPQNLLNSQKALLCSSQFMLSISNSVKSMPERQAGGFVEELKNDFSETLKWMSNSNLDFDLKSEILGRVFSEFHAILIDSLTVTSSNSLLIANSVENLMKEIRPSFRLLVQNKPENKNKNGNENENLFISSLAGGAGIPFRLSVSSLMVLFFRVYVSSRSLIRQLISLMSPDQARKSSELIGNLFATKFGTEWLNNEILDLNNGYFYWISDPSISLFDLINDFSDSLFSENNSGRFCFVYSIILMVFQRLNDLNRQIRVFKFLQKEEENNSEKDKKKIKKIKQIIRDLETEAIGLCNFLTKNLDEELRNCEGLLGLLCKIPAVNFSAKISVKIVNYILHLERLVVSNFSCENNGNSANKPLKLFLSCRRALRYIITSSDDWCPNSKLFSNFSKNFGEKSSFNWLLISLQKAVDFNSCDNSKEIKFYLADHTSQIIMKLSEGFSAFSLNKREELIELYETNIDESNKCCLSWKNVEIMAEFIQNQIEKIPITKKGDFVNYFCIISCFQGFLWGLVSALDKIPINNSSEIEWFCSRLEGYFRNFETFVDIFLYFLLLDGDKESIINTLEMDLNNGFVNFGEIMRKCVEKQTDGEITDSPLSQLIEGGNLKKGKLFESLLKGEKTEIAFIIRELFIANAAIFKLNSILSPQFNNITNITHKIHISNALLNEMANTQNCLDNFSFVWLEGPLRFVETIGGYLNKSDFNISKEVYSQLINSHFGAIGKCISLEGKPAKLSTHDTTKSLEIIKKSDNFANKNNYLIRFKTRVRASLRKLINEGVRSRIAILVQIIERGLVGVNKDSFGVCDVNIGNFEGQSGNVSSTVAAGVDCFYLALDSLSGKEHVIKKSMPSLVSCLLNITSHLQSPSIFRIIPKIPLSKSQYYHTSPDPGAVVLMCVEVLTAVIARNSCPMEARHLAHCLNLPDSIFKNLKGFNKGGGMDEGFSVDLFGACCKLLWTALKHRIREVGPSLAVLEESTTTLLTCLETNNDENNNINLLNNNDDLLNKNAWDMQEALKCAMFFRRIYEEIRQQKDVLASKSFYFLSTYINIYSGYGPSQTGIKREIDEALRPGVYALIDICTQSDLQQLHTELGEGPRRSTLASLLHDYKIHFQYEGKI